MDLVRGRLIAILVHQNTSFCEGVQIPKKGFLRRTTKDTFSKSRSRRRQKKTVLRAVSSKHASRGFN